MKIVLIELNVCITADKQKAIYVVLKKETSNKVLCLIFEFFAESPASGTLHFEDKF